MHPDLMIFYFNGGDVTTNPETSLSQNSPLLLWGNSFLSNLCHGYLFAMLSTSVTPIAIWDNISWYQFGHQNNCDITVLLFIKASLFIEIVSVLLNKVSSYSSSGWSFPCLLCIILINFIIIVIHHPLWSHSSN